MRHVTVKSKCASAKETCFYCPFYYYIYGIMTGSERQSSSSQPGHPNDLHYFLVTPLNSIHTENRACKYMQFCKRRCHDRLVGNSRIAHTHEKISARTVWLKLPNSSEAPNSVICSTPAIATASSTTADQDVAIESSSAPIITSVVATVICIHAIVKAIRAVHYFVSLVISSTVLTPVSGNIPVRSTLAGPIVGSWTERCDWSTSRSNWCWESVQLMARGHMSKFMVYVKDVAVGLLQKC